MEKNIRCNGCGRRIKEEKGLLREDVVEGRKEWGYFSKKDLQVDTFYLCEACYDSLIENFKIPITREEKTEAM